MGMGQQESAPLRRKVQCKPFLPGTFWFAVQMGTAGVHPCAVPRGSDAFGGPAVSLPGVAMGQAVPQGECLRGGKQGHGSATTAKAMALRCAKSSPFSSAFSTSAPWHDSLEGFPTVSIPGRRSIPRADRVGTTDAVTDSTSIRGHGFPRARESLVVPCVAHRSCPRCAAGRGRPPNNVPNPPLPSKWPLGWAWCCRWVTMPPPDDGKTIQVAKGAPQTFARIGRGCRWQVPVGRHAMVGPTHSILRFDVVDVGDVASRLSVCFLESASVARRTSGAGPVCQARCRSGKQGPRFGVETFVRDKPPGCADRSSEAGGNGLKALRQGQAVFNGVMVHADKEPFFRTGIAVQLLGVKQYFTSSFKLSLRSLRR